MNKKHEYRHTIGFNESDPVHRQAVQILNSMKRGKADYIAKAIMYYEGAGGGSATNNSLSSIDFEKIQQFVLKIMREQMSLEMSDRMYDVSDSQINRKQSDYEDDDYYEDDLGEATIGSILGAIEAFRK